MPFHHAANAAQAMEVSDRSSNIAVQGKRVAGAQMLDGGDGLRVTIATSIHDVDSAAWDACAGVGNPFVSHGFLAALEESASVSAATGWLPRHIVVSSTEDRVLGCMPLYLKSHSYGEYVFDWSWAEAYERAGGRYYPKLQAAVPFTPVTGPRLLLRADAPAWVGDRLATAATALAARLGASSVHLTFAPDRECARLTEHGFLLRVGHQYHWRNEGYRTFDDFLAALASRKRKAIRKERAAIDGHEIVIKTLTGDAIGARHWDAFHRFYLDTIQRKSAHAYLNRDFFRLLGERMADRVVLVLAETGDGVAVAGALNLLGDDALYGRYWGCLADYRFLHFEVCYYQAIDFAIAHGLSRVEAGAQGQHKIQRGYLPCPTYSAHWIANDGLRRAVARFLIAEREAAKREIAALAAESPFRRDGTGG